MCIATIVPLSHEIRYLQISFYRCLHYSVSDTASSGHTLQSVWWDPQLSPAAVRHINSTKQTQLHRCSVVQDSGWRNRSREHLWQRTRQGSNCSAQEIVYWRPNVDPELTAAAEHHRGGHGCLLVPDWGRRRRRTHHSSTLHHNHSEWSRYLRPSYCLSWPYQFLHIGSSVCSPSHRV